MIWSVAWKNIWRNKSRSIILLCAVVIGLFGGLFASAIFKGMVDQRVKDAIRNESANIQVHDTAFMLNKEIQDTIPQSGAILRALASDQDIKAFSPRLKITSMISTASSGKGARIIGVDPEREKEVTAIWSFVADTAGTWFASGKPNTIVIGRKLASELKAKLRSKVIVTFQSLSGDVAYGAFRVEGIYKTSNTGFDEMNAFVRYKDLAALAGMDPGQYHEIAIALKDDATNDSTVANLHRMFPEVSVMGWKEEMPDIALMSDYTTMMLYIILIIILIALSFGIANTILMSVLERTREIGMLIAVGTSRSRVFLMIMLESIFLTMCGALLGMAISSLVIHYFGVHGMNLMAYMEAWEDMGFSAIIYTRLTTDYYLGLTLLVILAAIVASILPARKALRMRPVEAIRQL